MSRSPRPAQSRIYQDLDSLKNRVRPCLKEVSSERSDHIHAAGLDRTCVKLSQVNDFLYR
jgi:hypothetical protein